MPDDGFQGNNPDGNLASDDLGESLDGRWSEREVLELAYGDERGGVVTCWGVLGEVYLSGDSSWGGGGICSCFRIPLNSGL